MNGVMRMEDFFMKINCFGISGKQLFNELINVE